MTQTPLMTLLHVSDLHFGELDPDSGDHPLDAQTLAYWKLNRGFDGYLGHTWRALCALSDLYFELQDGLGHEERLHVVVSGDLTTTGRGSQIATALQFLTGTLKHGGSTKIGFGLSLDDCTIVPGNHDHWPGRRFMMGAPTPDFGPAFHVPYPKSGVRIPLGGMCSLVLAQIDSDDEVGHWSKDRLLARGSFVQQCLVLEAQLGSSLPNELRVLVVHHSTIDRGDPSSKLKVDAVSLQALQRLVASSGIKVVLTGHWHFYDFLHSSLYAIHEARCGTTTVRDYFNGRRLYPNGALVHRLSHDGTKINWATEVWLRPLLLTTTNPRVPVGSRFEYNERIDFGTVWP